MFSHGLDRARHPLASRAWGVGLGSIMTVAVAAALISARTVPFSFAVMVAAFLAAAALRGHLVDAVPLRGPVFWHVAAFLLYALASAAWAIEPATSFLMTLLAILVALGTFVLCQFFAEETRPNLLHMGEGAWAGFIVGLLYLSIEVVSDQSLKIWVYNAVGIAPGEVPHEQYLGWAGDKLVSISREDLSRNMAPLTLFLWPAVMAIVGTLARRWAILVAGLTVALAGAVVMIAWHETSKLTLVAGVATFLSALVAPRLTGRVVMIGWVTVCLAMLPAALLAHRLGLHEVSWMQQSAGHRIIIWNYTAEQVLKAPLFGVGARTTYVLGPLLEQETVGLPDAARMRTLSAHSHRVYLQTWFELGLVGAALLTLLGLSLLQAIGALAPPLQPYAYATFTSAAVMAASSYVMWQIWFVSMFGFSAALFGLGHMLLLGRVRDS
jgi:O-antigen ligase